MWLIGHSCSFGWPNGYPFPPYWTEHVRQVALASWKSTAWWYESSWWFGTFPYIEDNHPNWRTHIFRWVGIHHQPVMSGLIASIYMFLLVKFELPVFVELLNPHWQWNNDGESIRHVNTIVLCKNISKTETWPLIHRKPPEHVDPSLRTGTFECM